ncbi:IS200/IS605 family element transposase accessory protein TnpB (plasmid) [Alicyclobacillus sp. TC]|uniref:RNA-guided endonuclease InsQ/TnpB family protein n=1 Tax=Alicyclobacillus sp. TC TaxID=2606450 RepID=UPI0019321E9E|nr:RNA-guided endonuclease TnpB family protein [Alicyclobacillus sp. TC]QRF24914.1 IS200/IS605 family element transposase accessory protein TnpB [Alicyclobacillus sp. TC]
MELVLTAKVKIVPTEEQHTMLQQTLQAYREGCNYLSGVIYTTKNLIQARLHTTTYRYLRETFGLRSQMAQSVIKTVIARYKSMMENGHDWTKVGFKKPELDLVWNRDYSLGHGVFSVNTLAGRVKVPFVTKGMEHYFDGTWKFGTAKVVYKHGKFFLHIPMTKHIEETEWEHINEIVGVDMGMNFLVTTYDSHGKVWFVKGRHVKDKRAHYKQLRRHLQQRQTASARRRLKKIGQRETRWMTDVNHQVSKALVERYGANALYVLEDLTGVREATEKVRKRHRYESVSWAYDQLRQMIEYKAIKLQSKVIAVDPCYTSQTCPKCGHIEKANRDKKHHRFTCKNCHYRSNDDRIGGMNLHRKGIEYLVAVTTSA